MKTLLTKLQFKLASWLYNQGIIAPQLLTHPDGSNVKNIHILTPKDVWTEQDSNINKDKLIEELKQPPFNLSGNNLNQVESELSQLIGEEKQRQTK